MGLRDVRAGKRLVKEDFKFWILCGQKGTDVLPRRKDVRKWEPGGHGGIEVVVMDT